VTRAERIQSLSGLSVTNKCVHLKGEIAWIAEAGKVTPPHGLRVLPSLLPLNGASVCFHLNERCPRSGLFSAVFQLHQQKGNVGLQSLKSEAGPVLLQLQGLEVDSGSLFFFFF
jgi:hypothetical protein